MKKLIALLLAITFITAAFTACGEKNNHDKDNDYNYSDEDDYDYEYDEYEEEGVTKSYEREDFPKECVKDAKKVGECHLYVRANSRGVDDSIEDHYVSGFAAINDDLGVKLYEWVYDSKNFAAEAKDLMENSSEMFRYVFENGEVKEYKRSGFNVTTVYMADGGLYAYFMTKDNKFIYAGTGEKNGKETLDKIIKKAYF